MTAEIFKQDAYVFEFEAGIVSVNGDEVVLDSTAFYPGGGGQVCDTGHISGHAVTDVFRKGSDIVHIVPGNDLKPGGMVWGSVDWNRRYDLMKGHTAEHLLFGSLKRAAPEISIVKIFISTESKYVIIDRDVSWDVVHDAVTFANKAIADNLTVRRVLMDRDDPELENIRVDLDKVKSGEVSVTEIGDIDAAACSGIHVMETEEIGAVFVDRKVSAGKDGIAIHFRIGWDAIGTAMDLGNRCLQISEAISSKPDDVIKTAANNKAQLEEMRRSIRTLVTDAIASLEGEDINGVPLYYGKFPSADGKIFSESSDDFVSSGSVAVLLSVGETVTAFVSSGSKKVDSGNILRSCLEAFGGRGGGKAAFAQGSIPDPKDADKLLAMLLDSVKRELVA